MQEHKLKGKGWAFLFDGPLEMVDYGEAGYNKAGQWNRTEPKNNSSWTGRKFENWQGVRDGFATPDEVALQRIEDMLLALQDSDIPDVPSRRRQRRYSDVAGDIDVDRAMSGNPEYMSEVSRVIKNGPTNVTIYCNLDAAFGDSPEKVFWRGGAAIAAADLLEAAGFATEIWVWCLGRGVYHSPNDMQFHAAPIKGINDPIDYSNLTNTLSSWFLRLAIFNSFYAMTPKCKSMGGPIYTLPHAFKRLIVPDPHTTHEMMMPNAQTQEEAIAAANSMLQTIIERV